MAALGDGRQREPGGAARAPYIGNGQRFMGEVGLNVLRTRRNERLHLCRRERLDLDFHGLPRQSSGQVTPRGDDITDRGGRVGRGEAAESVRE
jgi:hypothetical protein